MNTHFQKANYILLDYFICNFFGKSVTLRVTLSRPSRCCCYCCWLCVCIVEALWRYRSSSPKPRSRVIASKTRTHNDRHIPIGSENTLTLKFRIVYLLQKKRMDSRLYIGHFKNNLVVVRCVVCNCQRIDNVKL